VAFGLVAFGTSRCQWARCGSAQGIGAGWRASQCRNTKDRLSFTCYL